MQMNVRLIDFCLQKLLQLVTQFRFQITHYPIQQANSVLMFQWGSLSVSFQCVSLRNGLS